MALFTAYFDASGSPDDSAAVVVAGFVATGERWVQFEKKWASKLEAFGVPSLHMKDFAHSRRDYESWKGNESRRRAFLSQLITVIRNHVSCAFVAAVMMKDFREMNQKYQLEECNKPYALAGSCCIGKVRIWAKRSGIDPDDLLYLFENGDKDKGDLRRCAERDFSQEISFEPKGRSVAFQAGDLLAYEYLLGNRKIYEVGPGALGMDDLRKPLQKLYKCFQRDEDCGVFDVESLEIHCQKNQIPTRMTA